LNREEAEGADIHLMSGRSRKELTDFICKQILKAINPRADDFLVDIGCGDGSLLEMASDKIGGGIGIVATDEERHRLERAYHGLKYIKFRTGLVQKLPIEDEVATKTVCHGVLLLLDSKAEVRQSMVEIARISRRRAFVWIGEIPEINEFESNFSTLLKKRQFRDLISITKTELRFRLQNQTIRMALNSGPPEARSKASRRLFFINPRDFIGLAETCGLRLRYYGKHREIDISGNVYNSSTRNDFLFLKE
jgi:ubiquinone/menaquinone biosynthesis C-methylase UbiE